MKHLIIIIVTIFVLASCQKEINIDLNAAAPQLIVEANLTNFRGPYAVKLSRTVNFDAANVFPAVTGATVVFTDNFGNSEQLVEITSGIYRTVKYQGMPGRTYKLSIASDGKSYEAFSTMPDLVDIYSLSVSQEKTNLRNPNKMSFQVTASILDPEGITNYYRYVQYYKGVSYGSSLVFSDKYRDGKYISYDLRMGDTVILKQGDPIIVELQNIDKASFDFYRTLREGAGGLGFLSTSPSNPISNLSNGALGYFSAYSISRAILAVP